MKTNPLGYRYRLAAVAGEVKIRPIEQKCDRPFRKRSALNIAAVKSSLNAIKGTIATVNEFTSTADEERDPGHVQC
jgi:hypothetical protein